MKNNKILKGLFMAIKVILIILVVLIIGIIFVQRVTGNKVRLGGVGIYTIISESMIPEYEVGDMIIAFETDEDSLQIGDDVVYLGEVGELNGKIITHKIVRIEDTKPKRIHTKGINNEVEDPAIKSTQIYGKVAKKLLVLSWFSKLMNNSIMFYIIVFVPFTLLVAWDIISLVREREEDNNQDIPKE